MTKTTPATPYTAPNTGPDTTPGVSTKEFAKRYLVLPESVRKRWSVTGSYFGVVPRRLSNGRLSWPTG